MLSNAHGKSDVKLSKDLGELELKERASPARLSHWEAELHGTKARQALTALVDASAFLDPPAEDIPAIPPPDMPIQRQIMARAVDYVGEAIHRLPNFFATRDTTRFSDTPIGVYYALTVSARYQPLHFIDRSSATVLYRDGNEVVDAAVAKNKKPSRFGQGMSTKGEFGPILEVVILDAAHGTSSWSRWEQNADGMQAVFRFVVSREKSHYEVKWCCVADKSADNQANFKEVDEISGYHGEIAVDPESGAILRLTVEADLLPGDPVTRAAITVDYGPVEIGGKNYMCPAKSVSLSVSPDLISTESEPSIWNLEDAMKTWLNDVHYDKYHLFRAETRILTGDIPGTDEGVSAFRTEQATAAVLPTPDNGAMQTAAAPRGAPEKGAGAAAFQVKQ